MAKTEEASSEILTLPDKLGACADLLYKTQQKRYAKQKEVDALKALETALSEKLIRELPKSEAEGVAGKFGRATIRTKEVPQVIDWDAFYKWITRTKSFDVLQKRVATKAVEERWASGKEVPGVSKYVATTVSVTKV